MADIQGTKIIILCMNEIPIGAYSDSGKAREALRIHKEEAEIIFPYEFHTLTLDAPAIK